MSGAPGVATRLTKLFSEVSANQEFCYVELQAFANMTLNVRKALCAVMVFAVVEKGNSVVMDDGEEVGRNTLGFCPSVFFVGLSIS